MMALVQEHLTENYPGRDVNRVADGFMSRFTKAQLPIWQGHEKPLNLPIDRVFPASSAY
jgi:hypothetical protein